MIHSILYPEVWSGAPSSFIVPQFCFLEDGYVLKEGVNAHRKVKGAVRSMTFSITPTGKYCVSILTEEQYELMASTKRSVGLDMGLKSLVVTSDGDTYGNNRYTKKYERSTCQENRSAAKDVRSSG